MKVFALGASRALGESVAAQLGVRLAEHEEREFEDGEHKCRPAESVRGKDVYVIQSLYGDARESVHDKLCRLLFFIGALNDADAARVTAVTPYLCYGRKDRKTKSRDPVSTRYLAQLFEAVGTARIVSMDVHNPAAFQNAFRCRTEHLEALWLFVEHFKAVAEAVTVLSPDEGGVRRARAFQTALAATRNGGVELAFMEKYRSAGVVSGETLIGEVRGRSVVIIDDLISTGGTIARAARACAEHGALAVFAAASHGLFAASDPGLTRLDELVVTDSVSPAQPPSPSLRDKLTTITVANLFAEAIRRLHAGGSIVELLRQ